MRAVYKRRGNPGSQTMKSFALAALLATALSTSALSTSAFAGQCDDDLKKVDTAIKTTDLPADQKAQVKDIRKQAADLCKAGHEAEGIDVLSEAKSMLAVQ